MSAENIATVALVAVAAAFQVVALIYLSSAKFHLRQARLYLNGEFAEARRLSESLPWCVRTANRLDALLARVGAR